MRNYLLKFRTKSGDEYLTVYARDLDHAVDLASEIEKVYSLTNTTLMSWNNKNATPNNNYQPAPQRSKR